MTTQYNIVVSDSYREKLKTWDPSFISSIIFPLHSESLFQLLGVTTETKQNEKKRKKEKHKIFKKLQKVSFVLWFPLELNVCVHVGLTRGDETFL